MPGSTHERLYRKAIVWIADNDRFADLASPDLDYISEQAATILVACVFDQEPLQVASDVARQRRIQAAEDGPAFGNQG